MAISNLRQKSIFDQFGMMSAPAEYGMGDQIQMGPMGPPMGVPDDPYFSVGNIPDDPLFGQQPPRTQLPDFRTGPVLAPSTAPSMRDTIDQIYSPATRADDRFNALLDAPPERGRPSLGRTLVASGMGFGGTPIETVEKVMQAPYLRDMADWKAKAEPFHQAASIEGQRNNTERQIANSIMTQENAARRIDETSRANVNKEEIQRARLQLDYIKSQGAKFETKGEYIMITWPNGDVTNSGIKTTNFSPIELKMLEMEARKEIAQTQGQTARDVARIRADDPTPGNTRGSTPTQDKDRLQLKMQELYDTDSEARNWIDFDGKTYSLKKAPSWGYMPWNWNMDEEKAAHARTAKKIHPNANVQAPPPPPAPETKSQPIGPTTKTAPKAADKPIGPTKTFGEKIGDLLNPGRPSTASAPAPPAASQPDIPAEIRAQPRVEIFDKKGKSAGWIPVSEVEAARKKGYRVKVGGG